MSGITAKLSKDGRLPTVKLEVFPLDTDKEPFSIDHFNSYSFNSNILVPVDTWSFTFKPPPATKFDKSTHYDQIISEGDTVQLTIAGQAISTGYVDNFDVAFDVDGGVRMTMNGRDLMGFLEDNDAVNADSSIIYDVGPDGKGIKLSGALEQLLKDTRINGYELVNAQDFKNLFQTIPGESKLAAMQRFLEFPNYLAWMSPVGKLRIGSPSFNAAPSGTLGIRILDTNRLSNVLSMNIKRASGQIPNAYLSVWTGNDKVQSVLANQIKVNQAKKPSFLYQHKHKIMRCISTAAPNANDVQQLSNTQLIAAAGGSKFLDTLAEREMARENINELLVSCNVVSHLNDNGDPYTVDQTYNVLADAAGVDETMYLYGLEYSLTEDSGQQTVLNFCKLNTIVAGGPVTAGST